MITDVPDEDTWVHSQPAEDIEVFREKLETPCQRVYQRACAKLQVLPSMNVYEHLPCTQMVLQHCGVGQDDVKAIAIALVVSFLQVIMCTCVRVRVCMATVWI